MIKQPRQEHRTVALKDINDCPIRDLVRFPTDPEKLDALMESMKATGYWGNILARVNEHGKVEVVDGQARLETLRQLHKNEPDFGVELVVAAEMNYSFMIQVRARLNDEAYNTVGVRHLVHDVASAQKHFPDKNIAELLGMPASHAIIAVDALSLIQAGALTWESLDSLNVVTLAEVVSRLKREQLERATREIRNPEAKRT